MKTPTIFGRKMQRIGPSAFLLRLETGFGCLDLDIRKYFQRWDVTVSGGYISSEYTAAEAAKLAEQYLTNLRTAIQKLEQGGTK